jgi:valyl-tRNA synthetase
MKRFDARKAIVKALKERNLFKEIKDTETVLPICDRSKDIIEPLLKNQWYVNCKDMAARSVAAVKTEKTLKIIPDFHENVWYRSEFFNYLFLKSNCNNNYNCFFKNYRSYNYDYNTF